MRFWLKLLISFFFAFIVIIFQIRGCSWVSPCPAGFSCPAVSGISSCGFPLDLYLSNLGYENFSWLSVIINFIIWFSISYVILSLLKYLIAHKNRKEG